MMFHTKIRALVAASSLAVVLTAAPLVLGRAQETEPVPAVPVVETLEQRVVRLEEIVAWQAEEIDRLARLTDGLVMGAERLRVAADLALELGFVEAGANPAAKEELLAGLRDFNAAVQAGAAPLPRPTDDDEVEEHEDGDAVVEDSDDVR